VLTLCFSLFAQIIIIPTTKLLIAKQDPSIEDVGAIDGILNAISPAITGSVAAEPEEVVYSRTVTKDGKSYYEYELLVSFFWFFLVFLVFLARAI
jgi:hypothetical protein